MKHAIPQTTKRSVPLKLRRSYESKERLTIGEYLLKVLSKKGLRHIFGIPGNELYIFSKMIEHDPHIQLIRTIHPESAGYMADAYARLKGIGCLVLNHEWGLCNANLIKSAFLAGSPLIVIEGIPDDLMFNDNSQEDRERLWAESALSFDILSQWTIAQTVIDDPFIAAKKIHGIIDQCLYYMKPVYLELPQSIVSTLIPSPIVHQSPLPGSNKTILKESVNSVIASLSKSKSPVLIVGHKVACYNLGVELLHIIESMHIPFLTTLMAKATFDEKHPLFYGIIGPFPSLDHPSPPILTQADLILSIGTSEKDLSLHSIQRNEKALKIFVDSRGTRSQGFRYPHVALRDFIYQLTEGSQQLRFQQPQVHKTSFLPSSAVDEIQLTLPALARIMHNHCQEHILVTEHGAGLDLAMHLACAARTFFASTSTLNTGYTVPACIALQIAQKKSRVIGMLSTHQFHNTLTELATTQRLNADPLFIILRPSIQMSLPNQQYPLQEHWDYTVLPNLFRKGNVTYAATTIEFEKALKTGIKTRGEFLLIVASVGEMRKAVN